jgi:hypothetical protein
MATIKQILEIEDSNINHIHLFKEGLFLKAYQHSAYLFYTTVKPFKPVLKYFKVAQRNLVLLGFPSSRLPDLFPQTNVKQVEEGYYRIEMTPDSGVFDVEKYNEWFLSIEEQQKNDAEALLIKHSQQDVSIVNKELSDSTLIEKILSFPLERSTPLDSMLFLSELQSNLRNCLK